MESSLYQTQIAICGVCNTKICCSKAEPITLPCTHQFHRKCLQDHILQPTTSMRKTLMCPVQECNKEIQPKQYQQIQESLSQIYYFCLICRQYEQSSETMIKSICKPGEFYHQQCFEKGLKVVEKEENTEEGGGELSLLKEGSILDSWCLISNSVLEKGSLVVPPCCSTCRKDPRAFVIAENKHLLCRKCGDKHLCERLKNKKSIMEFDCSKCQKAHDIFTVLLNCEDRIFYEDMIDGIMSKSNSSLFCIICSSKVSFKIFEELIKMKGKKGSTISKKFAVYS
jgi:hypothetical protein